MYIPFKKLGDPLKIFGLVVSKYLRFYRGGQNIFAISEAGSLQITEILHGVVQKVEHGNPHP